MANEIETRLEALGIVLPPVATPAANYVPNVIAGKLVFVAGQVPVTPDGLQYIGKLGREFTIEDGQKAARICGINILANLKDALGDHPHVGDVRGKGLMCAVEIVEDRATGAEFEASQSVGARIHAAGVERGMFSRVRGDVYCLAPPIVTTEAEIDRMVSILAESVESVLGK